MRYARRTKVSAEQSRREVEHLLAKYGATGFGYSWERREVPIEPPPLHGEKTELREFATIMFRFKSRAIRLDVPMSSVREAGTKAKLEVLTRQRWRALVLVIKAKLEAVDSGISTLDSEFLANVVTTDGVTVGDVLVPHLSVGGDISRLLPAKT